MDSSEIQKLADMLRSKNDRVLGKKIQRSLSLGDQLLLIREIYGSGVQPVESFKWLFTLYPIESFPWKWEKIEWSEIVEWMEGNPGLMPYHERRKPFEVGVKYRVFHRHYPKPQGNAILNQLFLTIMRTESVYKKSTDNLFHVFNSGRMRKSNVIAVIKMEEI